MIKCIFPLPFYSDLMKNIDKHKTIYNLLKSPVVIILVVALAYAVVARLNLWIKIQPGNISPIFPSAGIALASVIIYRRPAILGVFLGSLLYNIIFEPFGLKFFLAGLSISIGAMSGAWAGAYLVRRYCKDEHPLVNARNIIILIFAGAIFSCTISPTVGVLSLSLTGKIPWNIFGFSWFTWWLADASGVIVVASLILAWYDKFPCRINIRNTLESFLLGITTLIFCYYIFFQRVQIIYFLPILLLYAAFRLGTRGAATLALAITVMAAISTTMKVGLYSGESINITLINLQLFLSVSIVSSFILAGIMKERKRAEEALQLVKTHYETLVENTPDIIARFDTDIRYLFVNSAIKQVSPIKPEDFIGKKMSDVGFSEEQYQLRESLIREAIDSKTSRESELEFGYFCPKRQKCKVSQN